MKGSGHPTADEPAVDVRVLSGEEGGDEEREEPAGSSVSWTRSMACSCASPTIASSEVAAVPGVLTTGGQCVWR